MNFKIKCGLVILVLLFSATIFFKRGFAKIQEGRQSKMDNVASQEKPKKSYIPVVLKSLAGKSAGYVKSIVHSENISSALISGHDSILHEEDAVHGATIVKIHKDKVEFAKNGHMWSQKVGERPSPEWYR